MGSWPQRRWRLLIRLEGERGERQQLQRDKPLVLTEVDQKGFGAVGLSRGIGRLGKDQVGCQDASLSEGFTSRWAVWPMGLASPVSLTSVFIKAITWSWTAM